MRIDESNNTRGAAQAQVADRSSTTDARGTTQVEIVKVSKNYRHKRAAWSCDEFYRAAISAGARDNISPRARLEYYPGYYAADIFDPDGYSFEVVHKSSRG